MKVGCTTKVYNGQKLVFLSTLNFIFGYPVYVLRCNFMTYLLLDTSQNMHISFMEAHHVHQVRVHHINNGNFRTYKCIYRRYFKLAKIYFAKSKTRCIIYIINSKRYNFDKWRNIAIGKYKNIIFRLYTPRVKYTHNACH